MSKGSSKSQKIKTGGFNDSVSTSQASIVTQTQHVLAQAKVKSQLEAKQIKRAAHRWGRRGIVCLALKLGIIIHSFDFVRGLGPYVQKNQKGWTCDVMGSYMSTPRENPVVDADAQPRPTWSPNSTSNTSSAEPVSCTRHRPSPTHVSSDIAIPGNGIHRSTSTSLCSRNPVQKVSQGDDREIVTLGASGPLWKSTIAELVRMGGEMTRNRKNVNARGVARKLWVATITMMTRHIAHQRPKCQSRPFHMRSLAESA
ncbi:hypothetical protein PIB30_001673 [Stylosanthes scabra]|uniref:Uncharacterized protein n=1 Tax=Stylosanthes scabra TaxID=79078 RepID=A0ABU6T2F8_9FABA|nr:hypothetical protein [Stylosanthes scabra]